MTVQLFNGNCLEFMRGMESGSVDCVLTDMPYGVGIAYSSFEDTQDNLKRLIADAMPEMRRVARRVVLTSGVANVHLYPRTDWILCWACSGGGSSGKWGFSTWQPLLAWGKDPYLAAGKGRRPDLIYCNAKAEKTGHPCPKPLEVWRRVLERVSLPGETVFDPFMGSGTTGVACVQTGRNFIGCEIDAGYFAIAQKRISDAQMQPALDIGTISK